MLIFAKNFEMDKEQEILQRIEQLRVEQLKALKELKKVEKAKKKQRRRTAHGYPVLTNDNENAATLDKDAATPAQHVMARSSKSCGRIDRARMKTKHAQILKRKQETPTISISNKDKSNIIENTAYFNKTEINDITIGVVKMEDTQNRGLVTSGVDLTRDNKFNAHEGVPKATTSLDQTPKTSREKTDSYKKKKVRRQKEVSRERSISISKDKGTISGEMVFKLGSSTDIKPIPSQFTEQAGSLTTRILEQDDAENPTPRIIHGSLKFPSANSSWQKSMNSKTESVSNKRASLERVKQIENIAVTGENSTASKTSPVPENRKSSSGTKSGECKRQDSAPERSSTNASSSHAKKELFKDDVDHFEDSKELYSTLSTNNKPLHSFSQNLFSQSLFDDIDDQSARNNFSDVCGPSTTNIWKIGTEMLTSKDKSGETHNGEDQKHENSGKNNGKMESAKDLMTSSNLGRSACTSLDRGCTDLSSNNAMQSEKASEIKRAVGDNCSFKIHTSTDVLLTNTVETNEQISLKKNDEKMKAKSSRSENVAKVMELLPPNCSPGILNVGEEAEDGKLSTKVKEDAPSKQAEKGIHGTLPSCLYDFESRFLLKETDRQLEKQEPASPSIKENTIAEYNPIAEGVLLKQQAEEMQPELIDDMSMELPQIFANELGAFDAKSESEKQSAKGEGGKQTNNVSKELKNLQLFKNEESFDFEDLLLSQPSPLLSQNAFRESHCGQESSHIKREICLQHKLNSPVSSDKVRHIKFLTHRVGENRLDMVAVCLSRLLVLWKAEDGCTSWSVMHSWLLEEDEEIADIEVDSVRSCIVLITGGNFHKALGRVYCVHGENESKFDIYEEVSFSDLGEIAYGYQEMCSLPHEESSENVNIILSSAFEGKIVLTKWTIDLICFCLEDCKDFPEVTGNVMSSLCLVQGSNCLLFGCVDSDVYLWNYNSCELLWRMTLEICLFTRPIFLSAETNSGMIFLSLLDKDENQVNLVAINPQTSREACLKKINMVDVINDGRNKLLHCSKTGCYVLGSFERGQIFSWNMATDSRTVFDQKIGDVFCISLHPEDSVIAFGTASGCVHLNVL